MPDMNYREKLQLIRKTIGRSIDHDFVEAKLKEAGLIDELESISWGPGDDPEAIEFEGVKDGHSFDFKLVVDL